MVQNFEMGDDDRKKIVQCIMDGVLGKAVDILRSLSDHGAVDKPKAWFSWPLSLTSTSPAQRLQTELRKRANGISDPEFLSSLPDLVVQEPLLQPAASDAIKAAHSYFAKAIQKLSGTISHRVQSAQEKMAKAQFGRELAAVLEEKQNAAKSELVQKIATGSQSASAPNTITLNSVEMTGHYHSYHSSRFSIQ